MSILRKQFLQYVGQTSPSPLMIEVSKASGVFFYTPEGKRYFDLISGVSVSNVGHSNRCVIDAVKSQVDDYMHVMVYGEMVQKPQVEYAKAIVSELPASLESVYFINSGSEAVEVALKLSKRYTNRTELVSFKNAYHGSTQGSLSVLGGDEQKSGFRPLLPDVRQLRYNNIDDLKYITDRTAGVIVEPIQGEAGVVLPDSGYLQSLRDRCTSVGALLIFDEIQSGFGRCGSLFATLREGVTPDVLCLAKALGGGMPLGAVVSSNEILHSFTNNPVLGHITTFGGHPVCCAAGNAAFKYIKDNNLVENANIMGALFERLLTGKRHIVEIRRAGLLLGVELGSSEKLFKLMELFVARGILSDWFLFCDTAFRISPPLTISESEVIECVEIIDDCLSSL